VLRLGLVGSPNSGKTTLFNALTGLRAKVGNYPGVTVERREGEAHFDGRRFVVIDLPGAYSLSAISPDEEVVVRVLDGELNHAPEALAVIADACTLERSLLLLAQILRRGIPTCLVLTMTDELQARGGRLDIPRLERALGIPVLGVVGHRGIGIAKLKRLLARPESWSRPHLMPPEEIHARAGWVESILDHVLTQRPGTSRKSDAADRIVLHPLLGPLRNGIYVTVAAGHPDASLLLDVFHLYKSGTPFASLKQLNGGALHVIHINDYPQAADSSTLNDGNRIYPGDGVAPFTQILRDLRDNGFRGYFSLELFNRDYWAKSADDNLKTGLEKIRTTVRQALG